MSAKLASLAKELSDAIASKDRLKAELGEVEKKIIDLASKKIPMLMEDQEIEKIKIAGIGTMYLRQAVYAYINKEDQAAAFRWMRENGHNGLVVEYVHPKTLQAFVKEQTENGKPLPEIIKASFIPTATIRKA